MRELAELDQRRRGRHEELLSSLTGLKRRTLSRRGDRRTMKQLLLIALAAAVTVAIRFPENYEESVRESIFRPGVEYVYRYESEALSGIKTVSDQFTGLKVRATVKMQIHRDGSTLLKMEDVTVYKINDGVTRDRRYEMVKEHQLQRLTGEEEQVMVEKLIKPIKFRFVEGEIQDVKTERADEYWSINIKKGLLSLLQLKISGRSTITDTESYLSESSSRSENRFMDMIESRSRRSRLDVSRATDNVFKVMEVLSAYSR